MEDARLLSSDESDAPLPPPELLKKKPWIVLCVLIFLLVAIIDIGAFLAEAPKTRVYEANLCVRYYEKHDRSVIRKDGTVPEKLCKVNEIQQDMAMIVGWQGLFESIPSIILAVPFGTLADKHGRKWVFVASLVGLQLNSAWVLMICYFRSLPLQLTWVGSVFFIIGGGPIVASAVGLTMVADIVPPDKRTAIFLYLTASVLLAELIAPIMAASLMKRGDWIPLILALAIQLVGVLIGVAFPETLHLRDLPEPKDDDAESDIELRPTKNGSAFAFKTQLRHFQEAFRFLRRDFTLALVIFTFMANRVGRQGLSMLLQYASKRYGWAIRDAAYLTSFRAATSLVALTIFIPLLNLVLLRCLRLPAHWADLWIARGSLALTTFAFVVIGIAAHPVLLIIGILIFNLGTGSHAAMRSISIHLVGGQSSPDVGRLFSVIAIMESIGAMVAGPLLAKIFDWGLDLGEPWIGLPYIVSAVVFGVCTFITFVISVKSDDSTTVAYTGLPNDEEGSVDGAAPRRHND
ncbi:MFS general substrate transporter [Sporormia fimetaria CBS 119925]|uniref:MFS general substrate transporter n=1 Tax=Sporormia fimetaria CBS 119925 TaxID=1340428 RepID=A0A6A6V0L6_9PLEO|nr:MFS general substrate transporter [Sporormia fimetaria CBS 119925]